MRIALSFLVSALCSISAFAQTPRVDRIEITEFGIYELKQRGSENSPGTSTGTLNFSEGKLVRSTATIPARLGISFGYSYRIIGSPRNAKVTLRDINYVPAPGLRNPDTGNVLFKEEAVVTKSIGDVHRSSYTLGVDWELLPGTWTFQLWLGDRKLAEQKFELVKP